MPIKYIFFDCDNTLVLSERYAFEACADLCNEVLRNNNIKFTPYTGESLLHDFVGQNFRGMMLKIQEKYNFTIPPAELDKYVDMEVGRVTAKLREKAEPCENVMEIVEGLHGKIPMAVVSTSAKIRVVASLQKVGLMSTIPDDKYDDYKKYDDLTPADEEGQNHKYWPRRLVFSAATSLDKPNSKPDPAIYNFAAKAVGIDNADIVTVEDSKSGATAAMRAGIPCVAYVGVYGLEDGKEREDEMAKILTEQCNCVAVMRDWKEFPDILKKIDPSVKL